MHSCPVQVVELVGFLDSDHASSAFLKLGQLQRLQGMRAYCNFPPRPEQVLRTLS